MTLEEYFKMYPEAEHYRAYLSHNDGVIQFDEETACIWGGPYPGGFASYNLTDYSKVPYWKDPSITVAMANTIYLQEHPETIISYPTVEKPVTLYLSGNDDTSYSKFFSSYFEAKQELDVLLSKQPLDFFKDLKEGWVFTN